MDQLRQIFGDTFATHVVGAAALFVLTLLAGWLLKVLLNTLGRRVIAKTKSELDDKILAAVVDRIRWLAIVFGAYLAAETISNAPGIDNAIARRLLGYADGIIFVSFVLVLTVLAIRLVDISVQHLMETRVRGGTARLGEALLPLTKRILTIILALIALIIVLDHFGQDVSSLVVSLGVGSLAIALAAQDTLSNMIAGFVIMTDRPFRVGDRIQLPSGEVGDVFEIGIRSTKILDFDNNLIVSPNAELVKSRIVNYSYPHPVMRIVVEVGVAYGTNLRRAREIILGLTAKHPEVLKDPAPAVFVVALADSSVNLKLIARTDDFQKKFEIETTLREQIYEAFLTERIEIPFPQRVVHLQTPHGKSQARQKRKTARR